MDIDRREAMKAALASTFMLAVPRSVAIALERLGEGDHRFLAVELADGHFLAIDMDDGRKTLLLRRARVRDGRHALDGQGALHIADGSVAGLEQPATTRSYELSRTRSANVDIVSRETLDRLLSVRVRRPR